MSSIRKERDLSERYEPPENARERLYPDCRKEALRDIPGNDPDRVSFMDSHRVYIEFKAKPGQVCAIYRDELGWLACVATESHFTLDKEFSTFRQAMDFAMEKAGL